MKAPLLFMLTADLECLLEKMHACQNNLEKYYADKRIKHTPSGYSIFTNCSFDSAKKKKKKNQQLHCYKGENCMESFCKDLRQHAIKIINFEKK